MIETAEEFVRLRTSDDPAEYRRAAADPAPQAVWFELVERYPEMRFWVAQNKTVPHSVLERLAADPDPDVRSMVARKRKLQPALMARLADDPNDGVRHGVVCNASCPPDILRRLASDRWSTVAEEARARLEDLSDDG
ncbi:MAG: HEAT repeat domain-containing protein [Gemmatimonadetes bacterium]|nr:HEAT repeat domain-containing protein [Gemmatimonadota bacterium]